ncbi:hypothetical protein ES703_124781 [subsurface metagenome]
MIIGIISFTLISGAYLYLKYRSLCERDLWSLHYRQARVERVSTVEPLPRPAPTVWDYDLGIPYWNPSMMIACGFDPRFYHSRPGDSDHLF